MITRQICMYSSNRDLDDARLISVRMVYAISPASAVSGSQVVVRDPKPSVSRFVWITLTPRSSEQRLNGCNPSRQ